MNWKAYIVVCFTMLSLGGGYFAGKHDGYRAGQIDAVNHRVFYHLERQADGSQVWTACAEVCEER